MFRHVIQTTQLIDSTTTTQVECEEEAKNIVLTLPRLHPFDLSIRLDHSHYYCLQTQLY